MSEEAFLAALIAEPGDVVARLVYADWLEERGDVRGEFLRWQTRRLQLSAQNAEHAALLRRERELRQLHPNVILPWERRWTLGRIQRLLRDTPAYLAKPCLTGSELAAWEAANGVTLPEEYRLFLLEIGNGGEMPGDYCDFVICSLESPVDPLVREPFPVPWERLAESSFLELHVYREEDRPVLGPGSLQIGVYPSSDPVFLVVTGELRGAVWSLVDGGQPEMDRSGEPLNFLAWFEDALSDLRSS